MEPLKQAHAALAERGQQPVAADRGLPVDRVLHLRVAGQPIVAVQDDVVDVAGVGRFDGEGGDAVTADRPEDLIEGHEVLVVVAFETDTAARPARHVRHHPSPRS